MGEHRRNHSDQQKLGGDRVRGEDPGRSVAYDRRGDGDNIERDRPSGREHRWSREWELGGDGREAWGGGESGKSLEHGRREPERDQAGGKQEYRRGIDQGRDSDRELDGERRCSGSGSGSGSVANISGRGWSFNTACEASATGVTGHGTPRYGVEGGKGGKGQDELAAARAALAQAAKAAAARVAGAADEERRCERFVALLE